MYKEPMGKDNGGGEEWTWQVGKVGREGESNGEKLGTTVTEQ